MQQHISLRGLVIRETDFGEYDRYITVLTETGIKMDILCRGLRRKGSKQAAAVRLFCYTEFLLFESREKYTLNDATLIASFWGITQDIEAYALCCYFSELVTMVSQSDEPSPAITRLFLYALRVLSTKQRPVPLVKAAFELRLFAEAGFALQIAACGACQRAPLPPMLSLREGTIVCGACAKRLGGAWKPLEIGTLAAMRHIMDNEMPRVFSFSLGGKSGMQLGALCEEYALYHAERSFESLTFYHSLFDLHVQSEGRTKQ